jgi:DNA-binding transcriptional LysR family regulator
MIIMSTNRSLNWDDMRVFLAVARRRSLSAAARSLKVTQPTVGRRLRALEETLATRLFDRLPDGFAPTAAGQELIPLAEEMERTAEALQRRQASLADRVSGTVRLSVTELTAQFLADRITDLRAQLPDIEFEIAVSHLYANLSKREADLVLRECLPDQPGLIVRKLADFRYAVYGSAGYVRAHPIAMTDGRYGECDWVAFDEQHAYFTQQKWLSQKLQNRQAAVRVNNGSLLHTIVRNDGGLGVLPCFIGDRDPDLVRVTPPLNEIASTKHIIVHPDLRRVPSIRAVMDALIDLFKREAPLLLGQTYAGPTAA